MERHGFSSPIATVQGPPTGELSPMAFLVGVALRRVPRVTPTLCVQRFLSAVVCAARLRQPIYAADASPSPLKGEAERKHERPRPCSTSSGSGTTRRRSTPA